MAGGIDPTDAVWAITPFVDYPGEYGGSQYRFEWEREWRVPGGLAFSPDDVAFLFIPEDLHAKARSFFDDEFRETVDRRTCARTSTRGGRWTASRQHSQQSRRLPI